MATTSDKAGASANNSGAGTGGTSGGGAGAGAGESGGALSSVRQGAADAYQAARDRTSSAYAAARERAGSVSQRTVEGIDSAPMAAILGGLALGAIAGALVPRTAREEELLRPLGGRLNETARKAFESARDSAREQLGDLGDRAASALKSSAGAAADSVTDGS